jgi:tetratricopeptide (TPR) repeat protein
MKQPETGAQAGQVQASVYALCQQGMKLLENGRLEGAVEQFRQVLKVSPGAADVHNNLGVALGRLKQIDEAIEHLKQSLTLNPDLVEACDNLALLYLDCQEWEQAAKLFEQVIKVRPHSAEAHLRLATAYRSARKLDEAVAELQEAIRLRPDDHNAWHEQGMVLGLQERPQEARKCYQEAIRLCPTLAASFNNLGLIDKDEGRLEDAVANLRESLRLNANAPETLNNLAVLLSSAGKHEEAFDLFQQCIRLRANYPEAYNNLGNTLRDAGRIAESVGCFHEALRQNPAYPEAYNNLGVTRLQQGELNEALDSYARALQLWPNYADAHKNRALAWLTVGEYEKGWPEYEWRWSPKTVPLKHTHRPRWQGEPLQGRSILLYAEQGLGDTLQFIRYARLVKQRGGRVLFECPPRLALLLEGSVGIDAVIPEGASIPECDVQAPLLSLPGIFKTTLDTIPGPIPSLTLQAARVKRWGAKLAAITGFKVGIAWQGNPRYGGDRQRSFSLQLFARLAAVPGTQLISLQRGPGMDQLAEARKLFPIEDLGPEVDAEAAFIDTAAMMPHLDLVVTSDSALAHLAGALGVPVWVALPFAADWRWLQQREDSPWYPSMRLFRQTAPGDWESVMARMAEQLARRIMIHESMPAGSRCTGAAPERNTEGSQANVNSKALLGVSRAKAAPVEALQQVGMALFREGNLSDAADRFREVLRLQPHNYPVLVHLGLALLHLGNCVEAAESFHKALQTAPESAETLNYLGVAFTQLKQHDRAVHCFRQALHTKPDYIEALNNLGNLLHSVGRLEEATNCYRQSLRHQPAARTYCHLGQGLLALGKDAEAQECFREALRLQSGYGDAYHGLGIACAKLGQLDEAIDYYESASLLSPQPADVFNDLGNTFLSKGLPENAAECYSQAIQHRSDFPQAHYNLGLVLTRQHRIEEALASYQEAVRLRPAYADAHNNTGVCLRILRRFDEAAACFRKTLDIAPNHAEAHWNRSHILLQQGNYTEGWQEYEWRWRCPQVAPRAVGPKLWDGRPLDGRTILLSAEGGASDVVQFVRYATLVKQQGGRVLVESPLALAPLLQSCPGVDQVVSLSSSPPPFDVFTPLLSLPTHFRTTLASVPANVPYLIPDKRVVASWQRCLQHIQAFKVGVALKGCSELLTAGQLPANELQRLGQVERVQFINLENSSDWAHELAAWIPIIDLIHPQEDAARALLDQAAIMKCLDLVITTDGLPAHLAGALGVPTWVFLPDESDWRWLIDREDSVWYPTMRLFRQRAHESRRDVLATLTRVLRDNLIRRNRAG